MYEQLTDEQMQEIWNKEAAGETEPPVAEPEPAQEVTGETEASAETTGETPEAPAEPDPYEGVPEVVRARLAKLDEIERQNADLTHQVKSAVGRMASLQRDLDLAKKAQQQTQSSGDEAPSQKQMNAAAKSPEKWESLKADFPDWAEAMEEFVNYRMGSQAPAVDPRSIESLIDNRVGSTQEQLAQQIEMAKIENKYPDWQQDVRTDDFQVWMQAQPLDTQKLAASPKARDAVQMLDLFYQAKNQNASSVKQERGARLAVAATQRGSSAPPAKTVDQMSPEELWNYEATLRSKRKA